MNPFVIIHHKDPFTVTYADGVVILFLATEGKENKDYMVSVNLAENKAFGGVNDFHAIGNHMELNEGGNSDDIRDQIVYEVKRLVVLCGISWRNQAASWSQQLAKEHKKKK